MAAVDSENKLLAAFTLVEMLVSIAVIAILLAITIPVLAGVREQAIGTNCLTHMRSAGQAMTLYAVDFQDSLPFGGPVEREVRAPDGRLPYKVGGVDGVAKGRWSLLLADGWAGQDWDSGLRCPEQPDYDPTVAGGTANSMSDGFIQVPMYSLSRAFWLDPRMMRLDVPWEMQRVRQGRLGDVIYPSEKSMVYEEIAFCIFGPDAEWAINIWGQTPYHASSVGAVDGSVVRMPRAAGLPAVFTWPMDATVDGVHGRDIPRSASVPTGGSGRGSGRRK